jgi:hypothetical protein
MQRAVWLLNDPSGRLHAQNPGQFPSDEMRVLASTFPDRAAHATQVLRAPEVGNPAVQHAFGAP